MRYYPKLRKYKASNVEFNTVTQTATSYGWWLFVSRINGKLVFNNYMYSNTTDRHQSKVRSLLRKLGISVDLTIEAPDGLQSPDSAIDLYIGRIWALEILIDKPGTNNEKNLERMYEIKALERKISDVRTLLGQELVVA